MYQKVSRLDHLKILIRWPTQKKHYFNAPIVRRTFSQAHNLKKLERAHTGEKLFKCPKCANSWLIEGTWGISLGRKAIQVHQELLNINLLENPWEDPLRRDSIQVHKVWQKLLNIKLLGDTRDHTGGKPFKCTESDKGFTRSSSRSMRKPFKCSTCD